MPKLKGRREDARIHYRLNYPDIVCQVVGANALLHATTGKKGDYLFLLQKRRDGSYSAIGGASDLFVDDTNNVIRFEDQNHTLRREFKEETGHKLLEKEGLWRYIGCYTTVNKYRGYPDVHAVGTYFSIATTPERIRQYASGWSKEGKIVILNTQQVLQALQNGKVSPNTEPALRKLLQDWYLLPKRR